MVAVLGDVSNCVVPTTVVTKGVVTGAIVVVTVGVVVDSSSGVVGGVPGEKKLYIL